MTEQSSAVGEYLSQIFSGIYFDKKSLKLLLEERSHIMRKLDLKPQRGDFQEIVDAVLLLFNQQPLDLEPANLLVLRQGALYYVFFSTDYKFIPLCKLCNWSVYVTKHGSKGRVVCCNPKCKRSVLQEFEVRNKENSSMGLLTKGDEQRQTIQTKPTATKKVELDKEEVLKAIDRILK